MADADRVPAEAPPSYQQATGSSSASRPAAGTSNRLSVPGQGHDQNAIPAAARRSMEDERRPLPKGWVRSFDPSNEHQFFVDTTKDPPRSIWTHPYDDETYLNTLSGEERERIEQESLNRGHPPSKEDIMASHTDDEDDHSPVGSPSSELPPRPVEGKGKGKDSRTFGRKFKDKVTGSTHEEREVARRKRAEQERAMYEQHMKVRQAMAKAAQTGEAQYVGHDSDGKSIYVEPPAPPPGRYGGPYGYRDGYGYNPYNGPGGAGIYNTPNARYIRPPNPYARPYGGGFGGGYGMPLALGGGLLGGVLLGGALGGF